MNLERFKLGKGITKDGKTEYIEVEVKLPENASDKDFQTDFTTAEYLIDNLMSSMLQVNPPDTPTTTTTHTHTPTPAAVIGVKMLMTFDEIERQDWKASSWVRPMDQGDRRARPGEDAYIPVTVADKRFIEMIRVAPNQKLELPPYSEIKIGGDGGLIVRKGPKKEKKAK